MDAVLNLTEEASRWTASAQPHPADRWVCKGEGKHGMDAAEAALERVREHHPWARPDPYHWLALRWLAYTSGASAQH